MIDLVLINPVTSFLEDEFYMPNLTTHLLQGWLRQQLPKKEVVVINLSEYNNDYNSIPSAKYYGISFTTPHVPEVLKLTKFLKEKYPDSLVIGGGAHASAMPHDTLQRGLCDAVVRGAGEKPLEELLRYGNSPQLIYPDETFSKMDTVWEIRNSRYAWPPHRETYEDVIISYDLEQAKRYKVWLILNEYGCIYDCNFCYKIQKGLYTFPEKFITKQLEIYNSVISSPLGIKFSSDNIFINFYKWEKHFEFCGKHGIPYEVVGRLDNMNKAQLELLKSTGCKVLKVGLESANGRILGLMNKREKLSDMQDGFELLEQVGVPYGVYLIAGYPTETMEEVRNTVEFVNKLKVAYVGISDYTVYPGSPDWYKLKQDDRENMMVDFGNVHHLGKLNTVDDQSHKGYMLKHIKGK